ncbi:hypothetical protein NMU03_00130 [Allocoprobacillus halotolerans]|uniref:Uncharacterized protein n=1 Tax=Allocoprobacillus halotolerans TaxID=2944914 RepID=A0ABY5I5E7_9FIRM|nr:hypothetical protein [Allocoprobacillus halotolerans]UTY39283.1 hypothetical protein NMU03_00130 [Allocoprobacillus halotolerans]
MNISKQEELEMLLKMQEGFAQLTNRLGYFEEISIDDLLKEIAKNAIHLTEQEILEKYKECINIEKTDDYFYEKDLLKWEGLDNKKNMINSDALFYLIDKIVIKNFDIDTLSDPFYITRRIDALNHVPKNQAQEKILGIIMSIVEYAKRYDIHSVANILEMYDVNLVLKDEIRRCHQRDAHFKKVIQSYYDTFEDADRSIYKIKS